MGEEIDRIPQLLERAEDLLEKKTASSEDRMNSIEIAKGLIAIAQIYALMRIHEVLERFHDGKD
jgi:hypothetical protein